MSAIRPATRAERDNPHLDTRPANIVATPLVFGRGSVAVRRPANLVTFCDGHGVFFVVASGQIRMAANTRHGEVHVR
jgi:hypothetical protein